MVPGSLMQVSRVCAPRIVTSKAASAGAGSTALNVATAITKVSRGTGAPVVFVASQDGQIVFGASALATATAAAGIPIAARTPYVLWVHKDYSYVSWFNAGGSAGRLTYWDPESP